jgi:membrane protease YdiL (CAAX protease family)
MNDRQIAGLLSAVAFLVIWLCVVGWYSAWQRYRRGNSILRAEYTPPPPVTMLDFVLVFCLQVVVEFWAIRSIGLDGETPLGELPGEIQLALVAKLNVARLGLFTFATLFLLVLYRRWLLPIRWTRLAADVWTGWWAFCMIAPLVYGIQLILSVYWKPSQHPIIQLLTSPDTRSSALFVCGIAAVVAAPLFEELVFRRLLHGWLDRMSKRSDREEISYVSDLVVESGFPDRSDAEVDFDGSSNPYSSETSSVGFVPKPIAELQPPQLPLWPLLVSGGIFALMHLGNGPDPIPLFFFAVWLGFVYRQTGRLLPCIVIHFLLNGLSFLPLALGVIPAP